MIGSTIRSGFVLMSLAAGLAGCNSSPAPSPAVKEAAKPASAAFPARPTTPPAAFTVFHFANDTATLVVKEDTADDQISALVWQLRDAARTSTLDKLKIKQKGVDDTHQNFRAHIYRGKKCAAEKYADGPPPCGGSYHAAGDYTVTKLPAKMWDRGVLRTGEEKETQLWDPDAPYTPAN